MTSYRFAVANTKPTECVTGVRHIGFNGTDTDLCTLTYGKVRAVPGHSPGYAPPVTQLLPATVERLPCSGAEIT